MPLNPYSRTAIHYFRSADKVPRREGVVVDRQAIQIVRSKKRDDESCDAKFRMNRGRWKHDEIQRFKNAFETYGRNWLAIAEAVGTRDKIQVQGYATTHILKLLRDGKSLPAKVLETGIGYTTSGRPLNPYSGKKKKISC